MPADSITFFFPAYNEAQNVATCLRNTLAVIRTLNIGEWEVLFVDDGSSDGTSEAIQTVAGGEPRVRIKRHETNRGYGQAVLTGIANANCKWFFMTDADLQFDVAEIAKLLPLTDKHDFVQGYRIKRSDRLSRIIIGRIYKQIVRILFPIPVRDPECSFRIVRKDKIQSMQITSRGPLVPVELVCRARLQGATFAEVGVNHLPRRMGESKALTVTTALRLLLDMAKLSWSLRRSPQEAAP